ncbi:MAG: hypothetical protein FJ291_23565 [Planctomycetes bacterium]|nr:hypothetical protein [Planctomycetota bacterium]
MGRKRRDPLAGPLGAVLKFFFSALFGCLISLAIAGLFYWCGLGLWFWQSRWVHILWIIPLAWGLLGILWFDQMLDWAREILEGFSGQDS